MHLQISPNGRILATASGDFTCKLWDILTYRRQYDEVSKEVEASHINLDVPICPHDDRYDSQIDKKANQLKIGEVL